MIENNLVEFIQKVYENILISSFHFNYNTITIIINYIILLPILYTILSEN